MNLFDKAKKILNQPVCDNCLGRQFAQLLHGYTNKQRGEMMRRLVAMGADREYKSMEDIGIEGIEWSNFAGMSFHNIDNEKFPFVRKLKGKKCAICNDLFISLDKWVEKIKKKVNPYEFKTFVIGTKLSSELLDKEEELWERAGIDWCEPIKAEINREIGKILERQTGKKFNAKIPEINIILDMNRKSLNIELNPLFVYGEYQKLIRGIPQTKWPSGKYKTSVEQIIAKPFMVVTKGKGHKFHGLGREDIDARCLGWRPFVLEILQPNKRDIEMKKLGKKIGKAVKVKNLRLSSISEVRIIKEKRSEKSYSMIVECEKAIKKTELKKLSSLVVVINQRTPQRVLHRRSDRMRKRKVISLKAKFINSRKFKLQVKSEAGLYIKELVSGDNGRTMPNISMMLGNNCVCKELDVIKIHV
ncbi:MAG: tRNA pseudouridine(54/55) synthase Pus10 [Candidatus Aenigmatarchaeota archaeon]